MGLLGVAGVELLGARAAQGDAVHRLQVRGVRLERHAGPRMLNSNNSKKNTDIILTITNSSNNNNSKINSNSDSSSSSSSNSNSNTNTNSASSVTLP